MPKPPLQDRSKKELANLARRHGVSGWESMKKEDLVKAILAAEKKRARAARKDAKASSRPTATKSASSLGGTATKAPPAKPIEPVKKLMPPPVPTAKPAAATNGHAAKPMMPQPAKPLPRPTNALPTARVEAVIPADKDLSMKVAKNGNLKDRIVLSAPDAFWLHAFWEITLQSVQRAEAALAQDWHGSKPILRLFDVTSYDTTSTSEAPLRDIVVHGGCNHWYIDVPQPPRSYRVDIGYLTRSGRFFPLSRSNVITPPVAGSSELIESGNSASGSERPEDPDDQFRRPLKDNPFGTGAILPGKLKKFFFDLDAELIVYVKTDPAATVTLQNEQVKLRPDGTATMRFSLPDSRQIIPAVATSGDGMEEQTIVLAVERNTKRLDPMIRDLYGENN